MPRDLKSLEGAKADLATIIQSLDTSLYVAENGDFESALIIAAKNLRRLTFLIEELKSINEPTRVYLEMTLANKTPGLDEDKMRIQRFEQAGVASLSFEEKIQLVRTLERLNRAALQIRKQIRHLFPDKDYLLEIGNWIAQRKKIIFWVGVPCLVAAVVGGTATYTHRIRHSLLGHYYENTELKGFMRVRHDPAINFRWGNGSPMVALKADQYSIRWTGFLLADKEGLYQFRVESDDGVRLWIDDQLLVNDWTAHALRKYDAQKDLGVGPHSIKVEYFENYGNAQIRLLWKMPNDYVLKPIPPKYFLSEEKYL